MYVDHLPFRINASVSQIAALFYMTASIRQFALSRLIGFYMMDFHQFVF